MTPFYFTYILECADGTLYAGWTKDLTRRVKTHNRGKGSYYTRGRLPVKLLGFWRFETQSEAMRWERFLKNCPRSQKLSMLHQAESPYDTLP